MTDSHNVQLSPVYVSNDSVLEVCTGDENSSLVFAWEFPKIGIDMVSR